MNTGKRLKNLQCPTPTRNKFARCKFIFFSYKFALYNFYIYILLLICVVLANDFGILSTRGHISSNRSQQITIDARKSSTQWQNIKKSTQRSKFDHAVIEPKRLFRTDDEGILFFVVRVIN